MAGLVFVLPLVLAPFGFQPFSASKEFVLIAGGIGIAFAFLIFHLEAGDPPGALPLRRTALDLPVIAFLLLAVFSFAVAYDRRAALGRLLVLLGGAGVFWVLSQDTEPAVTRRAVGGAVVASASIVAAYAIGEFFGVLPSYRVRQYVLVATLGNPNYVAEFLALSFPAGLAMFLRVRKPAGRTLLLVALAAQYAAILLSGSRGAWGAWVLGTAVAAVTLLAPDSKKLARGLWVPALAVLLLFETVILGRYVATVRVVPKGETGLPRTLPDRFDVSSRERQSFRIRAGMTRDALRLIRDHPLLGVGVGNYFAAVQPYVRLPEEVLPPNNWIGHAHNDYLEILAELGPVGLLAFLGILALAFRRGRHLARSGAWPVEEAAAALAFVTSFAVNSLINFGFYEPVPGFLFWVTMGSLAASSEGDARDRRWLFALQPTRWPVRPLSLGLMAAYGGLLALAVQPVVADAHIRRAARAYQRSDLGAADQHLARALALDLDSFLAHFVRVKVLEQQGRRAEAAGVAREALRRFPGAYILQQALGEVLEGQGDLRAARAAYEQALQFYPYLSASVVGLGSVAEREGDLTAAAARYEEALRLNPKSHLPWTMIGRLHLRSGEVPEAVGALRTARDLMPDNSAIAMFLGQAYFAAGDRVRGLMELDRARRMDPMNLEILQAWRDAMANSGAALPPGHPSVSPPGHPPLSPPAPRPQ